MSTTIRVTDSTRERIASLARASGTSMSAVVEAAVDALERRRFFAEFNERYAELYAEGGARQEIEAERALESSSLRDTT